MSRPSKYEYVMSVIRRRIDEGDYLIRPIPGERKIAEETGVSYMTARRAVSELVKQNVLVRNANGMLEAGKPSASEANRLKVVLLYPSFPSPHLSHLRWIVGDSLRDREFVLRPVQYTHWNDPVVNDAIQSADGTIIIPTADPIPDSILKNCEKRKVVLLDGDLSEEGIPSIQLFPDAHVLRVFDHLAQLGHKRIDCVNAQNRNREIDRRIALWRTWVGQHSFEGELLERTAPSFSDPTPAAYDLIAEKLRGGDMRATALVCTTYPAAVAAVRALWEHKIIAGTVVSVGAVNLENHARYHCPSITGLEMPNLTEVLNRCLDWFSTSDAWKGSCRLQPRSACFYAGESTGVMTKPLHS